MVNGVLRHQNNGDNSSGKEDDTMDEEYSGPYIGQTSLRRGTRVKKQVKHIVPTHKGQSYDQGVAIHQVSHLRVSEGDNVKG